MEGCKDQWFEESGNRDFPIRRKVYSGSEKCKFKCQTVLEQSVRSRKGLPIPYHKAEAGIVWRRGEPIKLNPCAQASFT
jgi:hypothetical protein